MARSDIIGVLPPTSQRLVVRNSTPVTALRLLTCCVAVLTLQALLGGHQTGLAPRWFWQAPLLKPDQALTILIGMVTFVILQMQFVAAAQPYVISRRGRRDQSLLAIDRDHDELVWRVVIRNVGPGLAVITGMRFRVATVSGLHEGDFNLAHDELTERLGAANVDVGASVIIADYTPGMALGANDDLVLLEAPLSFVSQGYTLDVELSYKGLLGDCYRKTIYLLPERPESAGVLPA